MALLIPTAEHAKYFGSVLPALEKKEENLGLLMVNLQAKVERAVQAKIAGFTAANKKLEHENNIFRKLADHIQKKLTERIANKAKQCDFSDDPSSKLQDEALEIGLSFQKFSKCSPDEAGGLLSRVKRAHEDVSREIEGNLREMGFLIEDLHQNITISKEIVRTDSEGRIRIIRNQRP